MKNPNYLQQFYDHNARWWSDNKVNSFWHEEGFRQFVKYFKQGDSIIDIGCANGIHVPLFLGIGQNLKYTGVDISQKMLDIAQGRYPHLPFSQCDILEPKTLPKNTYHGFWAAAILMHFPEDDWPRLLKNIQSICRPKAIGYITLPKSRPNPASPKDQRHFSFWNIEKLESTMAPTGWLVLENGLMPKTDAEWCWYIIQAPK